VGGIIPLAILTQGKKINDMNFFRAKTNLNVGQTIDMPVFKGQLFYVDSSSELPGNNKTAEDLKDNWEELVLHNNYGQIRLVPRK